MSIRRSVVVLALLLLAIQADAAPTLERLVDQSDVAIVGTVVHKFGFRNATASGFTYIGTMNIVALDDVVFGSVRVLEKEGRRYVRLIHVGGVLEDGSGADAPDALDLPVGIRILALLASDDTDTGDYYAEMARFGIFQIIKIDGEKFAESLIPTERRKRLLERNHAIVAEPAVPFDSFVSKLSAIGLKSGKQPSKVVDEAEDYRFPGLFPLRASAGTTPTLWDRVDGSDVAIVGTVIQRFGFRTQTHTGYRYIATMNLVELEETLYGSVRALTDGKSRYVRLIHAGGTAGDGTSMHAPNAPNLAVGSRIVALLVADETGSGDYYPPGGGWDIFRVTSYGNDEKVESTVVQQFRRSALQRGKPVVADSSVPFGDFTSELSALGLAGGKGESEVVEELEDERFPDLFPLFQ